MVVIIGNGISNLSSNPGQGFLRLTSNECFYEIHQSITSSRTAMGKEHRILSSLALVRQLV